MANEFWEKYYSQLNGATIEKFLGMNQDEDSFGDGFPRFQLRLASGETWFMEVSQDPEGNGGGFLFLGDEKEGEK